MSAVFVIAFGNISNYNPFSVVFFTTPKVINYIVEKTYDKIIYIWSISPCLIFEFQKFIKYDKNLPKKR